MTLPAAALPPLHFILAGLPPPAHESHAQSAGAGQRRHARALHKVQNDNGDASNAGRPPGPMEKPQGDGENRTGIQNEDFGSKGGVPPENFTGHDT